jgi:hypothetical protein
MYFILDIASVCPRKGVLLKITYRGVHLTNNNHPCLKEFQSKLQVKIMEVEVTEEEEKQQKLQHEGQHILMKEDKKQQQQIGYEMKKVIMIM